MCVCVCVYDIPNLGLSVVFHCHREHINGDDYGDEEVKIMASAECVNIEARWRVVCIVWPLQCLWKIKNKN